MELVEFLLARIADDEADAMVGWRWKALPAGEYDHLQARVLAECKAKRRIVEFYGGPVGLHYSLRFLAEPYADHPDYRAEWAVERATV